MKPLGVRARINIVSLLPVLLAAVLLYTNVAGLLGAIAVVTAVGFILAVWLRRYLANAIGDLVDATRNIGNGVRGIHIPRHDEGELGELATAIEWMARQLQSREDELRQAQAATKPAPRAKIPSMAPGKVTRSTHGLLAGARVVLVEDAPHTQRVLRLLLEHEGALVETLSNGQEAVDFLGSYDSPCVVLMDIQMPGLDGFAATQQLREMGFASPIIAVTARASREDRERCLKAGCNDFLPKPIRRDELIQLLAGWVAHAEAGQDVDGEVSAEELAVAMSA